MSEWERLRKEIEDLRRVQQGEFNAIMASMGSLKHTVVTGIDQLKLALTNGLDQLTRAFEETHDTMHGYFATNDRIISKLIASVDQIEGHVEGMDQMESRLAGVERRLQRLEDKIA